MSRMVRSLFLIGTLVLSLGASSPPSAQGAASYSYSAASGNPLAWQAKVAPQVLAQVASGPAEFLVVLKAQADLSGAQKLPTKAEKGAYVYRQLSQLAARTQKPVLAELKALGVSYRSFWVTNMIWVRGNTASLQAMALRADVAHIDANPWTKVDLPQPVLPLAPQAIQTPDNVEASISQVNAPQVWAAGYNGQGVVVGGQDTGYQWDHEALKDHYRGWNGTDADHNYNWHDAVHSGGTSDCPPDSKVPCDDYYDSHGTHTMGTMVGEDPGGYNKIGMAPGARWIGCRNMNVGVGSPASYSECFQWFIAPTDLNGQNPRPDLAPDVINNSWGCTDSEGCTSWDVLQSVVDNARAAGIMVVASAGNSGSACNTIDEPPAVYDSVFTVGATDNLDNIAYFSSRGPSAGSNLLKPDIVAPGVSVYSSIKTGYGYLSGTSMASPHVSGLVALLISADPLLRGNVDDIEDIIRQSSVPLTTTQTCGGLPGSQVPNNTYGYGRIDAWKAFNRLPHLLAVQETAPSLVVPGDPITYTLTVTHTHPLTPTSNVLVSAEIPLQTSFLRANGNYSLSGNSLQWSFPQLGINESQTVQFVVASPNTQAIITSGPYQAISDQVTSPVSGSPVTTTVDLVRTLELTPPYNRVLLPGEVVIYTHNLTNTGNVTDSYTLALDSSRGWASLATLSPITLPPAQSTQIQVVIDIPTDEMLGQIESSRLMVTSLSDPTVSATILDTTTVGTRELIPLLLR
jgi:serine protease AprX